MSQRQEASRSLKSLKFVRDPMETIQADKMVTMRYVMKTHLTDGTLKDHPEEEFNFIFGVDRQVPTLKHLRHAPAATREHKTIAVGVVPTTDDQAIVGGADR